MHYGDLDLHTQANLAHMGLQIDHMSREQAQAYCKELLKLNKCQMKMFSKMLKQDGIPFPKKETEE